MRVMNVRKIRIHKYNFNLLSSIIVTFGLKFHLTSATFFISLF